MQEQRFSKIQDHIQNIRSKLAPHILSITMGKLQEYYDKGTKTFEKISEIHAQNNIPVPSMNNTTIGGRSTRAASRIDDGKCLSFSACYHLCVYIFIRYCCLFIHLVYLFGQLTRCIFSVIFLLCLSYSICTMLFVCNLGRFYPFTIISICITHMNISYMPPSQIHVPRITWLWWLWCSIWTNNAMKKAIVRATVSILMSQE